MEKISFVIPVYNSENTIENVVNRILATIKTFENQYNFEIILVNDGSKDKSYSVCQDIGKKEPQIKTYNLTRNFGQACAIMAGLNLAEGDYIICLDDDLQTPPEEFPKLLDVLIEKNYDLVYGFYIQKQHSRFRNFGAYINQKMQNMVLQTPHNLHSSSYFVTRKNIVKTVVQYNQPYPYLPGLFFRVTKNICSIPINHEIRKDGKSGYTIKKLLKLWSDGFINFSFSPLRFSTYIGAFLLLVSIALAIFFFILNYYNFNENYILEIIIILMIFFGGIQLFSIGLLGEYIGRMFMGLNGTPQYVLSSSANLNKNSIHKKDEVNE